MHFFDVWFEAFGPALQGRKPPKQLQGSVPTRGIEILTGFPKTPSGPLAFELAVGGRSVTEGQPRDCKVCQKFVFAKTSCSCFVQTL